MTRLIAALAPLVLLSGALVLPASCGQGKSEPNGEPPGDGSGGGGRGDAVSNAFVALGTKGSALAVAREGTAPALLEDAPTGCHIGLTQTVQGDGLCLTPDAVALWAANVTLGSTTKVESADPFAGGGARLLGGGTGFEKDGYFSGAPFDLTTLSSLRGEDNLFQSYDTKPTFDAVDISAGYLRIAFTLKGSAWDMLVPFVDHPVESIAVLKSCYDKGYIDQAKTRATLVPGLAAKTGDMLFCKRADASTPCAVADFRWLDTATTTLVATRPSKPKALASVAGLVRECKTPGTGEAPPDARYDIPSLRLRMNSKFKLYADFSHGAPSRTNPTGKPARATEEEWQARTAAGKSQAPFMIYVLEKDGKTTQGDKLEVSLAVDASGYLFFDGLRNLNDVSEEQALAKLTTKEFFAWEKMGLDKVSGLEPAWKADVTIKVSNSATLDEVYVPLKPDATPVPVD